MITVAKERPRGKADADTVTRRARCRRSGLGVLTAGIVATLSFASLTSPFSLVELRSFDYLSTFSPPPLPKDGPVIVAIDEPSMAEIGSQWPWPRA